jgi:hypothetical protein
VLSIFDVYIKEALQCHIRRTCHLVEIFSLIFFCLSFRGKTSLGCFFSVVLIMPLYNPRQDSLHSTVIASPRNIRFTPDFVGCKRLSKKFSTPLNTSVP